MRLEELTELFLELINLGLTPEDVCDKLNLDCESVTVPMVSTWLVQKYSITSLVRVVADGGVLQLKR